MGKRIPISPNVLVALALTGLFLAVLAGTSRPALAQASATATPTPNPTLGELENVIATQQAQIEDLSNKLTDEERDRKYNDRDIYWKWGILAAIATAAISILTWVGIRSLKDLQEEWKRSSQKILDKAIYKLDLGNLPIYLPVGENLENIHRLLQFRKFEKVGFYKTFDEISRGVIIVSLKDKDDAQQAEVLQKFKIFIETKQPSYANVGFIIYAPGKIRVPEEITNCYDNLVTANYPITVVNMIFVAGRGIDINPPESDVKEGA